MTLATIGMIPRRGQDWRYVVALRLLDPVKTRCINCAHIAVFFAYTKIVTKSDQQDPTRQDDPFTGFQGLDMNETGIWGSSWGGQFWIPLPWARSRCS